MTWRERYDYSVPLSGRTGAVYYITDRGNAPGAIFIVTKVGKIFLKFSTARMRGLTALSMHIVSWTITTTFV